MTSDPVSIPTLIGGLVLCAIPASIAAGLVVLLIRKLTRK